MSQSGKLKAIVRKQAKMKEALENLTAVQEAFSDFARETVASLDSEIDRITTEVSYPGLNFANIRDALCPGSTVSGQTWIPDVIGTMGSGPWEEGEFDFFLQDRGIKPVDVPHATVKALIVGAAGWSEDKLEKQIYGRTASDLRIYTQELFVLGLILRQDPFEVLEQPPIDDVGGQHPAIQHVLNRDFIWPWPSAGSDNDHEEFSETEFDWAEESVLRKLGYSARVEGPGQMARQRILSNAFQAEELPGITSQVERKRWGPAKSARRLYALSHFLRWLINFQGSDKPDARDKWANDLKWLRSAFYKPTMSFSWPTIEPVVHIRTKRRTKNAAFMKPLTPSPVLASIVGSTPIPRTEIVSKLWSYIKENKLQDAINKRMVNADQKLLQIFGKRQVSMFEMAGLISRHVR